MKDTMAFG